MDLRLRNDDGQGERGDTLPFPREALDKARAVRAALKNPMPAPGDVISQIDQALEEMQQRLHGLAQDVDATFKFPGSPDTDPPSTAA